MTATIATCVTTEQPEGGGGARMDGQALTAPDVSAEGRGPHGGQTSGRQTAEQHRGPIAEKTQRLEPGPGVDQPGETKPLELHAGPVAVHGVDHPRSEEVVVREPGDDRGSAAQSQRPAPPGAQPHGAEDDGEAGGVEEPLPVEEA